MVAAYFMVKPWDTENRRKREGSYPGRMCSVKRERTRRETCGTGEKRECRRASSARVGLQRLSRSGVRLSSAGGGGGARVRDDGKPVHDSHQAGGS